MIQSFTFTFGDAIYAATLWSKAEGRERYYIKRADGSDFACFHIENAELLKAKGAWPSAGFKAGFLAAFQGGREEAAADARAIEEVEQIQAMMEETHCDVCGTESAKGLCAPCQTAADIVNTSGTIEISGASGKGCDGFGKGQVLRNPQRAEQVLVVLEAKRQFVREDGLSMGLGAESGYFYSATCREATSAEADALQAAEAKEREESAKYLERMRKIGGSYNEG